MIIGITGKLISINALEKNVSIFIFKVYLYIKKTFI